MPRERLFTHASNPYREFPDTLPRQQQAVLRRAHAAGRSLPAWLPAMSLVKNDAIEAAAAERMDGILDAIQAQSLHFVSGRRGDDR